MTHTIILRSSDGDLMQEHYFNLNDAAHWGFDVVKQLQAVADAHERDIIAFRARLDADKEEGE